MHKDIFSRAVILDDPEGDAPWSALDANHPKHRTLTAKKLMELFDLLSPEDKRYFYKSVSDRIALEKLTQQPPEFNISPLPELPELPELPTLPDIPINWSDSYQRYLMELQQVQTEQTRLRSESANPESFRRLFGI